MRDNQDLRYREIEETREAVEAFVQGFSDLLRFATLAEKRWIVRACVESIQVDGENGEAICQVRTIPVVNDQVAAIYKGKETKTAPFGQAPFRTNGVAGTGAFVCAKLYETFTFQF